MKSNVIFYTTLIYLYLVSLLKHPIILFVNEELNLYLFIVCILLRKLLIIL